MQVRRCADWFFVDEHKRYSSLQVRVGRGTIVSRQWLAARYDLNCRRLLTRPASMEQGVRVYQDLKPGYK